MVEDVLKIGDGSWRVLSRSGLSRHEQDIQVVLLPFEDGGGSKMVLLVGFCPDVVGIERR